MEGKKWYGLTIPKKAAKVNTKGKSVFESDDSDDNVEDHVRVKKEPSSTSKERKKVAPESKSEEIDPTIYEYDSIYDEMKASQKQKTSHTKSKEPRYINLLLKAAKKRKNENERRVERKIQAERVKEEDTFKDKEAFVTSAYRKKMLEMEEEEERERRESALEEMMDSTKQKDLSGFYRHFLKQTVGEEKVPEFGERDIKVEGTSQKKQNCLEADKTKQRSESPSGARNRTKPFSLEKKVSHNDVRHETERSYRSDPLNKSDTKESQHGSSSDVDGSGHSKSKSSSHRNKARRRSYSSSDSEGRKSKSGHSKSKVSSHKSKGRQRSGSSSDSEDGRSKYSVEKNHKKKSDPTIHGTKYVHDEKQKYSYNVRNQEEKIHDRTKSNHHTEVKQTSSPDKYRSGHSSSKEGEKSKHEKHKGEYKKDHRKETHHRKEKESSQTSSKPAYGNQSYNNDKNFDNKSKPEHPKGFCGSPGESKKQYASKRRESTVCAEYPESKKMRHDDSDDDDDDDTSYSSSDEDKMKPPSSKKAEESKKAQENLKIDIETKFAKRTVDKIFDAAQARYFKRRDAAKAMN